MSALLFDNSFASPWFLLLLPLPLLLLYFSYRRRRVERSVVSMPGIGGLSHIRPGLRLRIRSLFPLMRAVALALLILALARPQADLGTETIYSQGIDIVLSTDLSKSMLAQDFQPNRLIAARKTAVDFMDRRPQDRFGLVVFSGESYTLCPITADHAIVKQLIYSADEDIPLMEGTAIGMGLATAVDRLRESRSNSKVVILLTDGDNNLGKIAPLTAAELAREYGIKVYTIGVGSEEGERVPIPGTGLIAAYVNRELLTGISEMTGGRFFMATNTQKLQEVYAEIDRLEKTEVSSTVYHRKKELYYPLALAALILLGIEFLLRYTYVKSLHD